MALTTGQIADHAQTGLDAVVKAQEYFNNFLTVSTFGGDYLYQHLHTLFVAFTNIKADAQAATPNTADVAVQVAAGKIAIDESQSYYNNYLTVSTFGGNYLFELLATIKAELSTIEAG